MWEGRKGVFDLAIDVKALLADALLELCEQKPLSKISVSDIQAQSGVSRQAFYNHFRDKQDLIQYIYLNRIIVPELIYTIVITLGLYPLILFINHKLEAEEKRSASKFV